MRQAIAAAAVLGILFPVLAGCSGEETAAKKAPEAVVAEMPPGRDTIYKAARGEPEPYVRALYAALAADALGPDLTPGQDPVYSSMMNARIGADAQRTAGSRVLTWEPLCNCPDGAGVSLNSVVITPGAKPSEAAAAVNITKGEDAETLTLKLVKAGPLWQVEDVLTDGEPPLSERVMRGIS